MDGKARRPKQAPFLVGPPRAGQLCMSGQLQSPEVSVTNLRLDRPDLKVLAPSLYLL
jgi:hypothetical protein